MFAKLFVVCSLLVICNYCVCNGNTVNTETPGFFLKVTKNVPRLGRRSHDYGDLGNFFLKTSKSVPRIGRSDETVRNHCSTIFTLILKSIEMIVFFFEKIKQIKNHHRNKQHFC